ncbi:MAG: methionyl-tRNA formyltransferase [Candidatus Omnitrophica bacterium]|nr:methionyl-tRNA formyltransferase [Candidatus Omnitrophota bacterium]
MNIIFFGSSQFAQSSLAALLERGYKVSCVVTQPDRKKGRGMHLEPTSVKALAIEHGLEVYQPDDINTNESGSFLNKFKPNLFVVVAYGQILSEEVLKIPSVFSINAHASLLPKYRGASPINRALINSEVKTGVTIIKLTKNMDAGPIIAQEEILIKNEDDSIILGEKLSKLSAELLIKAIIAIENNKYELLEQDENKVSFAPKLKKDDGLINWSKSANQINDLIRGCLPWPGAFTHYNSKLLKIFRAEVGSIQNLDLPGKIIEISKEGLRVSTSKDSLIIKELQIEGKRRMKVEEFIAGHKICVGEMLK